MLIFVKGQLFRKAQCVTRIETKTGIGSITVRRTAVRSMQVKRRGNKHTVPGNGKDIPYIQFLQETSFSILCSFCCNSSFLRLPWYRSHNDITVSGSGIHVILFRLRLFLWGPEGAKCAHYKSIRISVSFRKIVRMVSLILNYKKSNSVQ